MSIQLIQDRLNEYQCETAQDEENALKEIVQEVCLAALSRSGFFKEAVFQGGTCLRIMHKLQRFSEDLDFTLKKANPNFEMKGHLDHLTDELRAYGFEFKIESRSQTDTVVKKAFLRDESWGKVIALRYQPQRNQNFKKIRIKIEIDTCPPAEGKIEDKVLDFPFPFSVVSHDLSTLFAGISHALLCRPYIKGRDWYDFLWYVRKGIQPNLEFLQAALHQAGPWKQKILTIDPEWYVAQLKKRIKSIAWNEASDDVSRFLKPNELASLKLWSAPFFLERLERVYSKPKN